MPAQPGTGQPGEDVTRRCPNQPYTIRGLCRGEALKKTGGSREIISSFREEYTGPTGFGGFDGDRIGRLPTDFPRGNRSTTDRLAVRRWAWHKNCRSGSWSPTIRISLMEA
jgi:hypothetical protein